MKFWDRLKQRLWGPSRIIVPSAEGRRAPTPGMRVTSEVTMEVRPDRMSFDIENHHQRTPEMESLLKRIHEYIAYHEGLRQENDEGSEEW